ncbi:MAG: sugar transferase [Clostridiales bacterium]|nr:sugar transferase [Clostridiales bacterium]
MKRILDILISVMGLIVLSPVLLVIVIAIYTNGETYFFYT